MNATHTDRQWIDEFVVELRLRGVGGAAIGDAAAAAESHAAESGESLESAFGDPRPYARELEFRPDQMDQTGLRDWVVALSPTACGLIALSLGPSTARAALVGSDIAVTWGQIAGLVLLALGVVLLVRALRAVIERPVVAALTFGGLFAVVGSVMMLFDAPAFGMPVWLGGTLTAVLLLASVILDLRGAKDLGDPVTDPLTGADRFDDGSADTRRADRAIRLQPWLFPVVTAALSALAWFTA